MISIWLLIMLKKIVNTNPGLEESSPWIKLIVPRMLDDALRLTIDHLFETKYDFDLAINNAKENSVYDDMLFKYNKIVNKEDEVNKEESLEENKNNENSDRLENKIEDNILINNSSKKKKNDNIYPHFQFLDTLQKKIFGILYAI